MKKKWMLLLVLGYALCATAQQPAIDSSKYPRLTNFSAQEDRAQMMQQLGIKALRPGPSGQADAPNSANYDESKANPYPKLPDVLTLKNGTRWVPGVKGAALAFDGVDDSAETAAPVLDTTKDYSVAAWVTLDKLPGNYATAVSQDGRVRENPFYLQYGQGAFAFSTPGGNRARLAVTPELNRWYHLVGVRDHTTNEVRLYVDGQRVAATTAGPDAVSTGPLSIGRAKYAGVKGDFWSGSVDAVHAYDHVLTDQEVTALYTSEKA